MKRYFEFVDAKSSKFWEVWIEGTTMFTRFGKIGANGQTTVKEFPAVDAAQAARDKSIAEKLRKGYAEGGEAPSANQNTAPAPGKAADPDPVDRWNSEELFEIAMERPMGRALFARKFSSVPIISTLFRDGDLLGLLAENPNTPVNILTTLAEKASFQRRVAENPNTPISLLASLFENDDQPVRRRVARKPQVPDKVPSAISEDDDKSPNDNPEDGTNPVTGLIDQAKQGLSMLEQLLEDMEDDEFYTLPPGEWEAKNGRDKDGFPLK